MTIQIKEVRETLDDFRNNHVLINDQILNINTSNPITLWKDAHGYLHHTYKNFRFKYHRLVFFLFSGLYPDMVDHIDRDINNNHPSNLRAATASQNAQNRGVRSDSLTGIKGITFRKDRTKNPYRAMICFEGKRITIGHYATIDQATMAYDIYANMLFHEFAVINQPDKYSAFINDPSNRDAIINAVCEAIEETYEQ